MGAAVEEPLSAPSQTMTGFGRVTASGRSESTLIGYHQGNNGILGKRAIHYNINK